MIVQVCSLYLIRAYSYNLNFQIVFKGIEIRPTDTNVLKKIKSDFMNRNRISTDIFSDAEASKILCEKLCLEPSSNGLVGFVQEINQNPFGLLLLSEIQVRFKF